MLDVASPPARRMKRASWLDPRLLGGVLLILISIVAGARLVAGADKTAPAIAAAQDFPAGHVLGPGDIKAVQVRLASAQQYFATTGPVVGKQLTRDVGKDELLPRAAVGGQRAAPFRKFSLTVKPEHMPIIAVNDLVDIIATGEVAGGTRTWTVAKGLQVLVKPESSGGFAAADARIVLKVPVELVLPLTSAARANAIDVVLVPASEIAEAGDIGNEAPRTSTPTSSASGGPSGSASPSASQSAR